MRGRDAVPGHPWALWGYRHVGPALRLGRPHPWWTAFTSYRYTDHKVAGYLADLGRLTRAGGAAARF